MDQMMSALVRDMQRIDCKERYQTTPEAGMQSCSHKLQNGDNCLKLEEWECTHANILISDLWPSELFLS